MAFPKFEEWLKLREGQDGRPSRPRKSAKRADCDGRGTGDKSSGSRSHVDDLSGDYKGHLSDHGEEEPLKALKKGGKAVAGPAPK